MEQSARTKRFAIRGVKITLAVVTIVGLALSVLHVVRLTQVDGGALMPLGWMWGSVIVASLVAALTYSIHPQTRLGWVLQAATPTMTGVLAAVTCSVMLFPVRFFTDIWVPRVADNVTTRTMSQGGVVVDTRSEAYRQLHALHDSGFLRATTTLATLHLDAGQDQALGAFYLHEAFGERANGSLTQQCLAAELLPVVLDRIPGHSMPLDTKAEMAHEAATYLAVRCASVADPPVFWQPTMNAYWAMLTGDHAIFALREQYATFAKEVIASGPVSVTATSTATRRP